MTYEEVGQVKRSRLRFGHLGERLLASKKLVAVGAGQALDSFFLDYLVDLPLRTAFGVGNVYIVILIAILANSFP